MNQITEKNRTWTAYTLYAILLTLGLLYILFPSRAVKDYLEARVDDSAIPVHISIGDISPSLAFGLTLRETELSRQAAPEKVLFRADRLFVRPGLWSYLQGKMKACFDGRLNDGSLEGCVQFNENDPNTPFSTSMTFRDILLGKFEYLADLIGRHVEGSLGGSFAYDGQIESLMEGTGEADLRLSNGRIELQKPVLDLNAVDFDEIWVKLTLKKRRVDLTHVELKGPNIYGTLTGTISIRKELMDSGLNLKGTVDPSKSLFEGSEGASVTVKLLGQTLGDGPLSFRVRGTLKNPRFDLI
ncbi:MAG: type II secretion system protein GspN [Deltaproteobacteria bacterium]|nr:type II secretion system protein GspN [Deltaproteobacteria bacterium]